MEENEVLDVGGLENLPEGNIGELLLKKKKFNFDEIGNNIFFTIIISFIHSLLSLVTFYLYYIYEFTIKDTSLFIIVEFSLFIIMFICWVILD